MVLLSFSLMFCQIQPGVAYKKAYISSLYRPISCQLVLSIPP